MEKFLAIIFSVLLFASFSYADDVILAWDPSTGADGYKIYMSLDRGTTWDVGTDVGNVLTTTITGVPGSGLVIFRVGAYNASGEGVRTWSGSWYRGDWIVPPPAGGLGIE